ncbi:helix-turn-helix transcriptional regulator [Subtercola frigoramans]|uniref:Transcriptional regulator with XRE-family HTH domain n=1 Tax=Subtercola frigoramans TaxID=120298 RepID=A0ABS2L4T3_9MICO|nr:helix-turn-helix transcriptional regulator [Subtercola frigoramans]MBM7471906.1 transcriptional regulator with XRE-family HTH domain [Subtercola frigoramans]
MSEIGSALRAWRDRVSPIEAGLPVGGDRRSPGLRREELAMLAGISVDYIVRLEQGRALHPSAQVLTALARALRLTELERDHLFRVGGVAVPLKTMVPNLVTPGVQHIVDRLGEVPVAVFSAAWDTLLVNDLWVTLFGDTAARGSRAGNLLWRRFTGAPLAVTHSAEHGEQFRRDLVADVHVASARYPDDVALGLLIADLLEQSEEFAELWGSATFGEHRESRKTVENTLAGSITFDCDVLSAPGSDLKIVVYTVVPGSIDADKLDLLRVSAIRTFG